MAHTQFLGHPGYPILPAGYPDESQEWPRQTKPKKGQFTNFSQGHSGTKVRDVNRACFPKKTPEFTKMGEIHELFVLALSLVWFAGATPEKKMFMFLGFRTQHINF